MSWRCNLELVTGISALGSVRFTAGQPHLTHCPRRSRSWVPFFWQTNFERGYYTPTTHVPAAMSSMERWSLKLLFCSNQITPFPIGTTRRPQRRPAPSMVCGHLELEQITTSFGDDNPPAPPPEETFHSTKERETPATQKKGLWTTARQTSTWINLIFGFGLFTPKNSVEA